MGKKVNGKKSKWIDEAAADSEAPSKKRREEGPSDSEKSAKKKLSRKTKRVEVEEEETEVPQKKRKKGDKKRRDSDEVKKSAKSEKKTKRTRLPNLNDDSELRRAKGSDVSYRESGKLGKLWAIVPKNYISLGKLTKLAKKEGIEPVIVRQYISLFRKAEALDVR